MSSLLAQHLERARALKAQREHAIAARPAGLSVEASEAQQQVWLHARLAGTVPLYNEPITIYFTGSLNASVFERSFNEILRRHEAWRTSFEWRDGKLLQVVKPEIVVRIPFTDLRKEPARNREHRARELATQDATIPIDVAKAPLFRTRLVQLGDADYRFYLTLHHLLFDGVSLYQVFLPELQTSYRAFSEGREPSLSPVPVQYADACLYDQQHRDSAANSRHMRYWERQLAGDLPELNLPLDRSRPAVRNYSGAAESFSISLDVTQKLKTIGVTASATPYMTFLGAFHLLLFRITGQSDQIIGTVTSTRKYKETEHLLGYFLNTILIRVRFHASDTFRELLQRVRDTTIDALDNEVPFSAVLGRFAGRRNAGVNPLFQTMFLWAPRTPQTDPSWKLRQMEFDTGTAKFDFYVELDDREEGLAGRFTYSREVFDATTIAPWKGEWIALLSALAANPDQPIGQLVEHLAAPFHSGSNWMRYFRFSGKHRRS